MKRAWLGVFFCLLFSAVRADVPEGQILANLWRYSFTPTGAGARAAGMADAFIAVSDDGTAASWNPAGLAQLRAPEFSVVFGGNHRIMSLKDFTALDGLSRFSSFRAADSNRMLDFASAAIPLDLFSKPVTIQASWQRMYDLNFQADPFMTEWVRKPGAAGQTFLLHQGTDLAGDIRLYSLSGAVQLTQRMALGASFNIWKGDWSTQADIQGNRIAGGPPSSSFLFFRQSNHMSGRNFSLGLLFTYPKFNVGLVYHSPFFADYQIATTTLSNLPNPFQGDTNQQTTLRFPKRLGLGFAWHPTDTWTAALDLQYNQWKDMTVAAVPPDLPELNFLDFQPAGSTSTRNTLSANAGAEYLIVREHSVIPIRFGVAYEPQGGMDPTLRSSVNYWVLACGTGFNTNAWKLDVAVQYRWANFRTGQFMEPEGMLRYPRTPDAFGSARAQEWRVNMSLIYRISRSEGLSKILHKVFVGD